MKIFALIPWSANCYWSLRAGKKLRGIRWNGKKVYTSIANVCVICTRRSLFIKMRSRMLNGARAICEAT